jgi:hypothetical protein
MKLRIKWKSRLVPPGYTAWVVYPFMLFRHDRLDVSDRLFRHELEHIYQVQRDGWLRFYFGYLWQWVRGGFKYSKIRYEIEAEAAEVKPLTPVERHWKDHG